MKTSPLCLLFMTFSTILLGLNNSSFVHLCEAVKLKHGARVEMKASVGELWANSVPIYELPQQSVSAPPGCSGGFKFQTSIFSTTASFNYDCNTQQCYVSRNYLDSSAQKGKYNFPDSDGYDLVFKSAETNAPVVVTENCDGEEYQPNNITFVVSGLVYNYSFIVFDAYNYQVTRTFDHLDNATLYINNELVANISANSSIITYNQTAHCAFGSSGCSLTAVPNPDSSYIGNNFLRFYFQVPTFIIPLGSINNTITDACDYYPYYSENEKIMCTQGEHPIGPCLSNDINSDMVSFGDNLPTSYYSDALCPVPTSLPGGFRTDPPAYSSTLQTPSPTPNKPKKTKRPKKHE